MATAKSIARRNHRWAIAYECAMFTLVALSMGMLLFDVFGHPTNHQTDLMDRVDFGVACVFMAEFIARLARSDDKWRYIRQDWWLFVASIPITGAAGDALRAMRLIGVIRIIRVVSHATYETKMLYAQPGRTRSANKRSVVANHNKAGA